MAVDVVVDVVVDVELGPSRSREAARSGHATYAAETVMQDVGGQWVAGGVHDQDHVDDHVDVHVHVTDGVREVGRALHDVPSQL